jgi:putative FmdB family regulatory protein
MPIYEFHCDDCATSFETLVRPGHDEDAQCPSCAGMRLSRELSVFASGRTQNGDSMAAPGAAMPRGGCCGGGCGCH